MDRKFATDTAAATMTVMNNNIVWNNFPFRHSNSSWSTGGKMIRRWAESNFYILHCRWCMCVCECVCVFDWASTSMCECMKCSSNYCGDAFLASVFTNLYLLFQRCSLFIWTVLSRHSIICNHGMKERFMENTFVLCCKNEFACPIFD